MMSELDNTLERALNALRALDVSVVERCPAPGCPACPAALPAVA